MKRIDRLVVLLLFGWCLTAAAALAQGNSAQQQLEQFSAGLETLHAKFEQKVIGTDGAVADESSGEMWLSRPQKFRWAYGGDFPELVVADGTRIWIYDEALEQVTVRNQSREAADSPLALLTDPAQLNRQFDIRDAGEAEGLQLLELRSRKTESEFERILLGLDGNRLELMIMEDAFGLRTELRFRDIERNPPLDESLFTFVPPAGADLIGDVPESAQGL